MILDVTQSTLNEIKNPALREYANIYVQIYQDFMDQVRQMGLEVEVEDMTVEAAQKTADLRKKGAVVRNDDKSIYVNGISPSCQACQTGIGSSTFFISLKCHRDCFIVSIPINRITIIIGSILVIRPQNWMPCMHPISGVQHVALTGGEPLYTRRDLSFL